MRPRIRRGFAWLLGVLLVIVLIIIAIPLGLMVALNSKTGRDFAVRQINQRSGGDIIVTGFGGHFPADLKLVACGLGYGAVLPGCLGFCWSLC